MCQVCNSHYRQTNRVRIVVPVDENGTELRVAVNDLLIAELFDSCERGLAHARLDYAIHAVVAAVAHPALTVNRRDYESGHTLTVRLLERPVLRWSFGRDHVDVYCRNVSGLDQYRLRYEEYRGWQLRVPGNSFAPLAFNDEQAKVSEMLRDAIAAFRE
jgi:hypothetical protein